jgi:hypothetical protein
MNPWSGAPSPTPRRITLWVTIEASADLALPEDHVGSVAETPCVTVLLSAGYGPVARGYEIMPEDQARLSSFRCARASAGWGSPDTCPPSGTGSSRSGSGEPAETD